MTDLFEGYVIVRDGKLETKVYPSLKDADDRIGWGNSEVGPRSKASMVKVRVSLIEEVPPINLGGKHRDWA
jgi:hypothetical protein